MAYLACTAALYAKEKMRNKKMVQVHGLSKPNGTYNDELNDTSLYAYGKTCLCDIQLGRLLQVQTLQLSSTPKSV